MYSLMENSVRVPQETKNRVIIWFISLTSGYMAKETETTLAKSYT